MALEETAREVFVARQGVEPGSGREVAEHVGVVGEIAIGQAAGLLMHRYDISSEVAIEVLKRGSQDNNIKLRQLALELVEAQNQNNLAPALRKYGLSLG